MTLYRQGQINFIINAEPDSFAQRFARLHGPSVCAIAFRVHDAKAAYERALNLGAWGYAGQAGPGELNIPAIKGIGDSLIYLVDRWRGKNGAQPGDIGNIGFFDVDFEPLPGVTGEEALNPKGHGLTYIDHLTHNVHRGRMAEWADFYERLFNFREIRYFDIEGQVTGVKSKAMTSPCGKIRIPINEGQGKGRPDPGSTWTSTTARASSTSPWARTTSTPRWTRCAPRACACWTPSTPITSWWTSAFPATARAWRNCTAAQILIDGKKDAILLQIFSENQLGPIFFEFIQRKGDDGFGNGNFKALFESIELDQMRRGVLEKA